MKRMKWWLLVVFLLSHHVNCQQTASDLLPPITPLPAENNEDPHQNQNQCSPDIQNLGTLAARNFYEALNNFLTSSNPSDTIKGIQNLEQILEATEVHDNSSMCVNGSVAVLYSPKATFTGLYIYANENEVRFDKYLENSIVMVRLPGELDVEPDDMIVVSMLTLPEQKMTASEDSDILYENRLVGLSVRGKNISGLKERVDIKMNVTVAINEIQTPRCVFLDFSTQKFSHHGCLTLWTRGQSHITCSCDHLTYFGVLMISPPLEPKHQEILTYITLIGCSLSLLALVVTVMLFIPNKTARANDSMKIHINLAIALILLNLHFLPSQAASTTSYTGLCLYMALSLHYSLLATFSWMALEGFHLYLLLVRVFNIYIKRYLLKLSVVGWGIPAVIVSLVVIIDRDTYGPVPLDLKNSNTTTVCYIADNTVKTLTTLGVFGLVFLFNLSMLGVMIRQVMCRRQKEFGEKERDRVKRDLCTLLGVTTLLGIPWGVICFSFGHLTTPGLYLFCILNSLQGFFIFLWYLMSARKVGKSTTKLNSHTDNGNREA